jgi:hypothetical protein
MSVNDVWYCVVGNLSGDRLLIVIKVVLTAFIGKDESNTPHCPITKMSVHRASTMSGLASW